MLLESNASLPIVFVFKPRQTPAMSVYRRYHVIPAVSVHIVGIELGWALGTAGNRGDEIEGMEYPFRISGQGGGLFVPAVLDDQVDAAIIVHIPRPRAVNVRAR